MKTLNIALLISALIASNAWAIKDGPMTGGGGFSDFMTYLKCDGQVITASGSERIYLDVSQFLGKVSARSAMFKMANDKTSLADVTVDHLKDNTEFGRLNCASLIDVKKEELNALTADQKLWNCENDGVSLIIEYKQRNKKITGTLYKDIEGTKRPIGKLMLCVP